MTPLADCRFYVEIDGVARAVFVEVSGLEVELEVEEVAEGGRNDAVHALPGRVKPGRLTLKRGLADADEFFAWCLSVAAGRIDRRDLSVIAYDPGGEPVRRWDVERAFPVGWSGPQLTAEGTGIAMETVELAFDRIGGGA